MKSGFVKIHRNLRSHRIATDPAAAFTFVMLLLSANHKRGWFRVTTPVEPGELISTWRNLPSRLYRCEDDDFKPPSINMLRRHLKKLEAAGCIRVEAKDRDYTKIVIVNWAKWQAGVVSKMDTTVDTTADTTADTDRRRETKNGREGRNRPTLAQISEFAKTLDPRKYHNAPSCAEPFHDHYTANGWRQGKGTGRPIKDWQAAFRGWVRRQREFNGKHEPEPATIRFDPRDAI